MSVVNMSAIEEFEELQGQMSDFSGKFDVCLMQKRTGIINDKQTHYVKVNDMKNQETQLEGEIEALRAKEEKVKSTIKQTMEDLQMQQIKVDELRKKQEHLLQRKDELELEVANLRRRVEISSASLARAQVNLDEQIKRDYPELSKYEQYLGLRIEVVNQDCLKFVFGNIDAYDLDREVWCELLVGEEQFKVGGTSPELGENEVQKLQLDFNEHKELLKFLKAVRTLLIGGGGG